MVVRNNKAPDKPPAGRTKRQEKQLRRRAKEYDNPSNLIKELCFDAADKPMVNRFRSTGADRI